MEKLLNEIKQYRKEQSELLDWNKHNGHPVMVGFDEGGLNACDKIIAIVERALGKTSDERSNCNKLLVSVSLPSEDLQKEWNACKDELELKGNAGEMGTYFAMFMHGWRGRNSEGFWQ